MLHPRILILSCRKLSTGTWLWELYFPLSKCLIPLFSSYEDNVLFTNSFTLSVWSIEGSPIWIPVTYDL